MRHKWLSVFGVAMLSTAVVLSAGCGDKGDSEEDEERKERREGRRKNACINNMRLIDSGKMQWAISSNQRDGDPVDIRQVNHYIKNNTTPECPSKGTYTYGKIGEAPTCTKKGHVFED